MKWSGDQLRMLIGRDSLSVVPLTCWLGYRYFAWFAWIGAFQADVELSAEGHVGFMESVA